MLFLAVSLSEPFLSTLVPATDRVSEQLCVWSQGEQRLHGVEMIAVDVSQIPVTVHIIFRSGGLCVSMLTGYFFAGRRYSLGQVVSPALHVILR